MKPIKTTILKRMLKIPVISKNIANPLGLLHLLLESLGSTFIASLGFYILSRVSSSHSWSNLSPRNSTAFLKCGNAFL